MEKASKNLNDTQPSGYEKYYYGKASRVSEKNTVLIGLIDASGSMCSCWPTLIEEWNKIVEKHFNNIHSIIFSYDSKLIEEKFLQRHHVGGGTNICAGFEKVYELIMKLSETEKDFTVVFISDGDDGNMNTISQRIKMLSKPAGINVNLLCIGVGSGFPTFVAMELREKYHVGLSSIPAVFLVSDYHTDFAINFSIINDNYLQKLEKLVVNPAVKMLPWSDLYETEIFETARFISDFPIVNINGVEIITKNSSELKKSEIEEIFKLWTQELQLVSLKDNIRKQATITVEMMEYIYDAYNKKIQSENGQVKKTLTVMERLEQKEKKSGTHLLQSLIAECKKMREGVSLKDLSASEAAKRLAIGTQQGKYHNKALNMRGINQEDFEKFRETFIQNLGNLKLNAETSQEPSFIILQTQKEVFMESTLIEALKKCQNTFELVEVFPLVGHTLQIRRSDSSMINPYNIQVLSIPRINKVCDTVSLISQGNEMEISIGNDEEEKFNAVIPLFKMKVDGDLRQLLRTKLYNLMMTFNVMKNVDTFFPDAYAGLLANTLVRLLKYPDSEWKKEMIDLIYNTTELVYGGQQLFEEGVNLLKDKPREAMITEHKIIKHRCEDVSKIMLYLLILIKRGLINEEKAAEIIRFLLVEHVGRFIKEGTENFEIYNGEESLEDFRFKHFNSNKDKKDSKPNNDEKKETNSTTENSATTKTETEANSNTTQSISNSNQNLDIISNNENIALDLEENVIDINLIQKNEDLKVKPETLEEMVERFIRNREHLKFDSIRDLKANLKKIFIEYNSKNKGENKANIRISKSIFNKPGYRINFSLFYDLHNYFCPNLANFDARNFWIAINHGLKYRDSHERSINEIEIDYENIRRQLTKKFIEKQGRKLAEKLYEGFETPIVMSYLQDFKKSLQMIKDFKCNRDLFKTHAKFDSNKPLVNLVFFGPTGSGKSSLAGRLLVDLGCIDKKLFEYYKKAYNTYFPDRENYPYEWLSNTAADERCKDKTIVINVSYINTKNKFVQIYDTPGSYKYYKKAISAMSLVDHFCLCLDADLKQIEKEIPMIIASFASLVANNCSQLHIVLTKVDVYNLEKDQNALNELIENVKILFNDALTKSKININLNIIPLSSRSGFNLENFINLIDGMKSHEEYEHNYLNISSNKTKILVLDTVEDKFEGKIIYGRVFGNNLKVNSVFVAYPSGKEGMITSCQVNENSVNSEIKPGTYVSLRLNNSFNSLGINKGSILHVNEKANKKISKKFGIKDISISLKYIGNSTLKINSCISVEFKYFRETLEIVLIKDCNGNLLNNTKEIKAGESIELKLLPLHEVYFESLWEDKPDCIIVRGPHYKVYGVGKMINMNFDIN